MALSLCLPLTAVERAGYDSRGRIIALLSDGGEVEVYSDYVGVLPDGKRVSLVERRIGSGPRSQGQEKSWSGSYGSPESGRVRLEWKTEDTDAGLRYRTSVSPDAGEFQSIEFVLDIARDVFAGGRVTPDGGRPVPLTASKPAGPALFGGRTSGLRFEDPSGRIAITVALGEAREVTVMDRWDLLGTSYTLPQMPLDEGGQAGTQYFNKTRRSYQVRIPVLRGPARAGARASLEATLSLVNKTAAPPARLAVDASKARYRFDGFGGNFCWDNGKGNQAIQAYLLRNLKHGWARTEMKIQLWDRQRGNPGPELRYDLETMRQIQKMGLPYVISVWRLPERFHAAEQPPGLRGHAVNPATWDELTRLIADYLVYARREYGVEPDLFSFNEANIGVDVRLTPEEHTAQIKRMGAAFKQLGLKTRMLLGDAVPARDTHVFALDAAADHEALQYVGAVGFHSWGGASPRQYAAWGDLAEWLGVPLLVTELGVDSQAFATNSWDSYHYGLREAQFTQEMLLHARPQGTQFWQYTDDFALARLRPDGTVEPAARFWLMKHFTDLTPMKSEVLATASDRDGVLLTAFRNAGGYALHIVNRGGACEATLTGAPDGEWLVTESTEAAQYRQETRLRARGGTLRWNLPARSLVTLTLNTGAAEKR